MNATDPLLTPPPMTERELCDQELVHAYGNAAVAMVCWIRQSDAEPRTRLEALARIADVAEFHRARLKVEVER